MKIPASLYFCCWTLSSSIFLRLGFDALDQETLKGIPPVVVDIFKIILAYSLCHSSYSVIFKTGGFYRKLRPCLSVLPNYDDASWMSFAFAYELKRAYVLFTNVCFITALFPTAAVSTSMMLLPLIWFVWRDLSQDSSTPQVPAQEGYLSMITSFLDEYNISIRIVTYAAALFPSILFQNYVKFTTFSHVLAFFYLVVAWLCGIALRMSSQDYGVFYFLLSNVVGCTVSTFGLQPPTWFVYAAVVLLFGLQQGLEAVRFDIVEDVVFVGDINDESSVISPKAARTIQLIVILVVWLIHVMWILYRLLCRS